ncbi:MAG: tRNA lysidine(34) synthetase TilS, partial [Methylobacter sp.]|nr:tRNA lysidine(34) synthetase TilS [Methylobacter sp.]
HCQKTATALGVDFKVVRVNAGAATGQSPEEAARDARYAAFKTLLAEGDVLLVGQHREDQLETVLLQLFRGSGLAGLSGMPERMPFGRGVLLRPFLNIAKQSINDYAQQQQLSWVEDPTNECSDYDRNFLRNQVLPLLKQRWPAIDKTVSRSAGHCAETQSLINESAEQWFDWVFNPTDQTLIISQLNKQALARQRLIIRQWFAHLRLKMPSQGVIERILFELVAAKEHAEPMLSTQGYDFRRYRDTLYCLKHIVLDIPHAKVWPPGQRIINIGNEQTLSIIESSVGILVEHWQNAQIEIKFRSGGEKISLPGRAGRHLLKKLFQEAGIPPWEREQMPLIYLNGCLAAVGELWISAEFYAENSAACVRVVWQRQESGPKDNDEVALVD